MNLTDQQHQAITDHSHNLIVTAGAGSGKTYVLVERYLRLLDANPDWSLNAIVAITFTRKAAEEMRDRVRRSLEERLAQTGADRWANLLGQIDSARIDTIHGLCASILRTNAVYAQLDPDFEVLDEIQATILLQNAVDVVMQYEVVAPLILEYGAAKVQAILCQRDLLNQPLPQGDLLEQWQEDWNKLVAHQIDWFKQQVNQLDIIPDPPKDDKLGLVWLDFLDCWHALGNTPLPEAYDVVCQIAGMKIGNVGSKNAWGSSELVQEARQTLMNIRVAAKQVVELVGDHINEVDARAAELLLLWGEAIAQVKTQYQAIKGHRLDFDDLEQRTCEVLRQPEVQARYRGAEFKHLLVDEFQDTNAYQWQIVKFLADLNQPGTMFVVGDEKQSIYAFRGADVSVFGDVQAEILRHGGQALQLSKSFRTHQPLIDCFNDLFNKLLVRDETSPVQAYQVTLGEPMVAHRPYPPDDSPCVEMILIPDEGDKAHNKEQRHQWEAYEIAQRIHELVRTEQPVFDKTTQTTRPMRYDDVAILFRALTNVNVYEDIFKATDLPFVTVAGRGYYDRQEVQDLLNLLKAVYNPADTLALACVLRSPMFGLSDDALLALRLEIPSLWQAIQNPPDLLSDDEQSIINRAYQCLQNLRAVAGRVTIAELLQLALSETGYLAILTALPDGARRRGNVEKLLEKAHNSGKITLGAFTQYLMDLTDIEAREGEAAIDTVGSVTLMTIHASKGLEFPVVVLADASRRPHNPDSGMVIYAEQLGCKVYDYESSGFVEPYVYRQIKYLNQLKEEAENLRLLYVALTRTQDKLIISGQVKLKNDICKADGWLGQLIDLWELQTIQQSTCISYSWGELGVYLPTDYPDIDITQQQTRSSKLSNKQVVPTLPLLKNLSIQRVIQARHLTASHIADLGSYAATTPPEREFYRSRFRQRVLYDAPTRVESIQQPSNVPASKIGNIVHKALRYGHVPGLDLSDDDLRHVLKAYAWQLGITQDYDISDAVQKSMRLLYEYADSDLFRQMQKATQIYRELPFVYQHAGVIIHGVIDALYQQEDQTWVVVDYKTSMVKAGETYANHARRYHLQIGIYAEAVTSQLGGIVPKTVIHYIRKAYTIEISEADWRNALKINLWDRVSDVIKD